jgi:hypothetical protein
LWVAVLGDPELTRSMSVPIEFRNFPQDLEVSSELPEKLNLLIRGPSGKLTAGWLSEAAAVVDLRNVHLPGERTFSIEEKMLNLPSGVSLSRAVPSQFRLRFERRMSRAVPVQARFAGPPPQGYRMARVEVMPDKVRIVGPESRILQVEAAETDPIDLSSVIGETSVNAHTFVADPQVRFESSPNVTVRLFMERIPKGAGSR